MRKPKSRLKTWQPEKVVKEKMTRLAKVYGRFGLVVEGYAKKELRRGHGVLTGTLRRSIHTAGPEYNFGADNVAPAPNAPERGGQVVEAGMQGNKLSLLVGSGMVYALKIHNGFGGFPGYHYITQGLKRAKPELKPMIDAEMKKK
jgi:hypothetical protein